MHAFSTSSRWLSASLRSAARSVVPGGVSRVVFRSACGLSSILLGSGAVALAACGSPPDLDDKTFPPLYAQGASAGGAANSGASGAAGSAVSGGAGSGTTVVVNSGGSSGSGATAMGGCPSDPTTLFNRNISQGGCTSAGGCHESTSPTKPDLVSPNVVSRLLNVNSSCSKTSAGMVVPPRPYIGATDSFLEEKIAGSPNAECGFSMPFLMPTALSAADRKCIVDWIHEVQKGAG